MANFEDLDDALGQMSPAYDVMGDSAHIVDMTGVVVYANAASELTYGFQDGELVGQHISAVIPALATEISNEMVEFAPNQVWKGRVLRQRKNGEQFEADTTIVLLKDASGSPIGQAAIVRDLSELEQMETPVRALATRRSTLAEIGKKVNSSIDINDVYASIAREIKKLLPFDRFSIALATDDEELLFVRAYSEGVRLPNREVGQLVPLAKSFIEHLLDKGKSVSLSGDQLRTEDGIIPSFELVQRVGLKSLLAVPVISQDSLVAIFYLYSYWPNAYTDEDQALAEQIASEIAGAIVNAQLHDDLKKESEERALLAEVGRIISSSPNIDDVFDQFAEAVRRLISFDRIVITSCDFENGVGRYLIITSGRIKGLLSTRDIPFEETLNHAVMSSKSTVLKQADLTGFIDDDCPGLLSVREIGLQSSLALPLQLNGEIIGVLKFHSLKPSAYTQRDVYLLERIGDQIAGPIANALLHEKQKKISEERELVAEVGRIISSSPNIDDVFQQFADGVNKSIGFDRIAITECDTASDVGRYLFTRGHNVAQRKSNDTFDVKNTVNEEVIKDKQSGTIVQGADLDTAVAKYPLMTGLVEAGLKSFLLAPMDLGESKMGVLALQSFQQDAFTNENLALARQIATQIAGIVSNYRVNEDLEHEAKEREILVDISRTATSSLELMDVYKKIEKRLKDVLDCDRVAISLVDFAEQRITSSASTGISDSTITDSIAEDFRFEESLTCAVVMSGAPVVKQADSDGQFEDDLPGLQYSRQLGLQSSLGVPLRINDKIIGVLKIHSLRPSAYSQRDVDFVVRIGIQIVSPIANAQLYEDVKRESDEGKILEDIGQTAMATSDLEDVCRKIQIRLRGILDCDRISICVVDVDEQLVSDRYSTEEIGYPPELETLRFGETLTGAAALSSAPVLKQANANGTIEDDLPGLVSVRRNGFNSSLGVPLIVNDKVIGVLKVHSVNPLAYSERDVCLVERIANQIAGSMASARLNADLERESLLKDVLANIGRIVSSSVEFLDVMPFVEPQIKELIPFDRIEISIPEPDLGIVRAIYANPSTESLIKNREVYEFQGSMSQRMLNEKGPVIIQGLDREEVSTRYPVCLSIYDAGYRSCLAIPLISNGESIGSLFLDSKSENAFQDEQIDVAQRISAQITGALVNSQLFADLLNAEQTARASEERFENILDIAQDAIISIDSNACIILFNSGAQETFGYTAEEVIGSRIELLLPERFRSAHHGDVNNFSTSDGNSRQMGERDTSIYGLRKNGEEFPAEASISKLDDGGETIFTVILRDISSRRQMETQLLQSQKLEAIGTLAGGVAHDFNNMLSAILSYAQLAMFDIEQGKPITAHLNEIRKAGERSAELTRQLLAFSRRQIFNPEIANLNDVILDIEKMLARMIGENIIIETRLDPDISSVLIDHAQIKQVLMNMAVNSRDAMPNGGILTLETANRYVDVSAASLQPELSAGSYVTFRVSDEGEGIPEELVAHIFEPFYTSKESDKGTGLGLSMCHGIVAQSGGHIAVETKVGKGTSFTVYLPAVDAVPEKPVANEANAVVIQGNETVLLVEDEPIVRRVATKILVNQGYAVKEATNGQEALEVLSEYPEDYFDILITDVVMPVMGGRELVEKFRVTNPDTNVLYMTGYTDDDIFRHDVLDDNAAVIQKPFTPNILAEKVREVLDR